MGNMAELGPSLSSYRGRLQPAPCALVGGPAQWGHVQLSHRVAPLESTAPSGIQLVPTPQEGGAVAAAPHSTTPQVQGAAGPPSPPWLAAAEARGLAHGDSLGWGAHCFPQIAQTLTPLVPDNSGPRQGQPGQPPRQEAARQLPAHGRKCSSWALLRPGLAHGSPEDGTGQYLFPMLVPGSALFLLAAVLLRDSFLEPALSAGRASSLCGLPPPLLLRSRSTL